MIARYGLADAWASKITVGLLTLCQLPFLIFLVGIYLANNPLARILIFKGASAIVIDAGFFLRVLQIQSWLALALCAWVAPRLISFDLADNALPILLSHPISRPAYVLGKFVALFGFLSIVTWVPALLLFCYQGYASPVPWFEAHLSLAAGLLTGSLLWIVFLAILGLALSAWVKWRIVATGLIYASIFVSTAVGNMITIILHTRWGLLLDLPEMMSSLWHRLLGLPALHHPVFDHREYSLPLFAILIALASACACFLLMLNARIRARGVVRG